jgi:hypothetical protein
MPISEDTRQEIQAVLNPDFRLPDAYQSFVVKWIAFNRAYSDLEQGQDYEKVLRIGDRLQDHWGEVSDLAEQLVSLECVGGKHVKDSELLKPIEWVKSATLYLREQLDLVQATDPHGCEFADCRPQKRALCDDVELVPWEKQEMAALLRLVYQVRCNLVHGDKRLGREDIQTRRDYDLVDISTQVLDRVLGMLLQPE